MKRLIFGIVVLIVSGGLMGFGLVRQFPVYEEDLAEDDFAFYEDTSEVLMTEYATFSGAYKSSKTDRLIINFDRSQPRGRAACPT